MFPSHPPSPSPSPSPPTLISLLCLLLLLQSTPLSATHPRRILHHPVYLSTTLLPPSPSSPPSSSPGLPFFPNYPSPPLPPPPPTPQPPTPSINAVPTFPSNVSSLALPTSPTSHSHPSNKVIILLVLVALIALVSFIVFIVILRRNARRKSSELKPLYPHDAPISDGKPPPNTHHDHVSHTSSEFLYLGTVTETSEFQVRPTVPIEGTATAASFPEVAEKQVVYHLKLCGSSPELKPLPPLPNLTRSSEHHFRVEEEARVSETARGEKFPHDNNQEFFSPSNSSRHDDDDYDYFNNSGLKSCFSSSSYHGSPCHNPESPSPGRDSDVSVEIQALAEKAHFFPAPTPPPPPPPKTVVAGPPLLVPPSGSIVMTRSGNLSKSGERIEEGGGVGMKPKLKALYWDKVRASSDRVTVWDQLHPGSFKLNEEMIETLFTVNGAKDGARRSILPSLNEEYRVLDPKTSQNIAILLKALSVTEKEVCEALLEGNADAIGTELLESLLKMAPNKEEERKLLEYNNETPMKLGPAEKFLRAVLDVPFAFKRVDAMLYMATFDSKVEYLRKAFETLEAACEQLRNSRMFLKLIEAVLKTGNRMNIGTNRGDIQAFKLDTLLKLIDIKGRDGKTTLLHFVVQEIIKAEGSRNNSQTSPDPKSGSHVQPAIPNDIESRKRGLEVVGSLGGELMDVKKSAAMNSDALSTDMAKLTRDINKIKVPRLNECNQMIDTDKRFEETISGFLKKAEMEIVRVQSQQNHAFTKVKELTEYFHGDLSKEEAHPFRIFTVVRDFLGVLDQVCKEVGKINERTITSLLRQPPASVNSTHQPPFPEFSTADVDENESVI